MKDKHYRDRCFLMSVLSADGRKVEKIFVSSDNPYSGFSPSDFLLLTRVSPERRLTMSCKLTNTAIFNSVRQKENLEQVIEIRKAIEKERASASEREKIKRWFKRRREKW